MATKRNANLTNDNELTCLIKSKSEFKSEVQKRIDIGEELLIRNLQSIQDFEKLKQDYNSWHDYNLEMLKQLFNKPFNEYRNAYDGAGTWDGIFLGGSSQADQVKEFMSKLNNKVNNLKALVQKTDLLKSSEPNINIDSSKEIKLDKSQVFIVHGHDEAAKTKTARFIEQLGLKPIILHEQASGSKTVIEKIEAYSNVGFGIVLYTACDLGAKAGANPDFKNRARQNVVFEHGFLIGKIGRENVCALVKDEIETPNDISGVVYVKMDNEDAWHLKVARELRNSGYVIDMNKL